MPRWMELPRADGRQSRRPSSEVLYRESEDDCASHSLCSSESSLSGRGGSGFGDSNGIDSGGYGARSSAGCFPSDPPRRFPARRSSRVLEMQGLSADSMAPFFRRAMRLRSETAALRMAGLDSSPPERPISSRYGRSSAWRSSTGVDASSARSTPTPCPAFGSLPIRTLREYKNRFRVNARCCTTKRQLVRLLISHFSSIAVDEDDVISEFVRKLRHKPRSDERPVRQGPVHSTAAGSCDERDP